MKRNLPAIRRTLPILVFTIVVLALLLYSPSGASDDNRAAVVVDFGNGQVAARCVSFAEESISGYEALMRTGLPVEVDYQSGGAAICSIDGQGCPPNDCFCSCPGGGDCVYWSYWHQNNGVWSYSAVGSGLYQLRDGGIDGWVWGYGSVTQAIPPPVIPFSEVCMEEPTSTPTATMVPSLTPTQVILPTAVPSQAAQSVPPTVTATLAAFTATPPVTSPPAQSTQVVAATPELLPSAVAQPDPSTIEAALPEEQSDLSAPAAPTNEVAIEPTEVVQPLDLPTEIPQPAAGSALPEAEQSGEQVTGEAIIGGSDVSGPSAGGATTAGVIGTEHITPTPVVIAAVVGADAAASDIEVAVPVRSEQRDGDWKPYAGFAGLLAFLGALALVAYHRRSGLMGERQ